MQKSVLNKQGKSGVKILWHYTDIEIFVLRCFILTHPVFGPLFGAEENTKRIFGTALEWIIASEFAVLRE